MAPTTMRMTPTVCRFTPFVLTSTAKSRMAPTAIKKMLNPIPITFSPLFGGLFDPPPDRVMCSCVATHRRWQTLSSATQRTGRHPEVVDEGAVLAGAGLGVWRPQDRRRMHGRHGHGLPIPLDELPPVAGHAER